MSKRGLPAVIFDNGSGLFKAGLADEPAPTVIFPNITGKPTNPNMMVGMDQKEIYVGPEASEKKSHLTLSKPIKRGIIQDLDQMEKIWHYTYENELKVNPNERPVLLTEPPLNDPKKREQLMEIFFEQFGVRQFYLAIQAVLGLFSTGRATGLVLDSGAGVTHTVPVYEGFALPFATFKLNVAGDDLSKYLEQLLVQETNITIKPDDITNREAIEHIKEKICYVAFDIDTSKKESDDKDKAISYTLPDGQKFEIKKAHFSCPEALFTPSNIENGEPEGIHDKAYASINKCEPDIHKHLYKNIVLIGGSTMFKGLGVRLRKEVSALAPSTMDIVLYEPLERKHSAWIGGSILSSIDAFDNMWITKADYMEGKNMSVVHKKCF
jgi:actin, other eukaryote